MRYKVSACSSFYLNGIIFVTNSGLKTIYHIKQTFAKRMSKLDNWKAFDLSNHFCSLFMTWHGWHFFFRIKLLHARKDGDDHWDFLVVSRESRWSELCKHSEFYMFFMGVRTYASILESSLLCGFLEHNFGVLFYSFSL